MKRSLLALSVAGLIGGIAFTRRQELIARWLGLPPAGYDVTTRENVRVAMPDGVTLATDLFLPRARTPLPSILIRTPYGRPSTSSGLLTRFIALRFAERGYNVVYQDVRGRFGSDGEWKPYVHEAADGEATIEWIAGQPWSDGQVGMWGQSYVGYTLWAAASTGNAHLKALVPVITQSFLAARGQQGQQYDRMLRWLLLLDAMTNPNLTRWERLRRTTNARVQDRLLVPGFMHLPMGTVDEAILGVPLPFFREWMEHYEPDDPYWQPVDFRPSVERVAAPVHLVAGWYDIFLEGQLADYARLRGANRNPYLTIGPWIHIDMGGQWESIRQALAWFDRHLKGIPGRTRERPVRLYVMGAEEWREYDRWPPKTGRRKLYLREQEMLSTTPPAPDEQPDRYRFDPADPTPNVGGALLSTHAGPQDNRTREARDDVLLYTGRTLDAPLEIIGVPTLYLWADSSIEHTDFFGRLTHVYPDGRSINIADGHIRLRPGEAERASDGSLRLVISLSPTAYRFPAGHRLRLQVSSGAHPRIGRNLGTGEPEPIATRMVAAEQTIYHDASRPSHLELPIAGNP